MKKIAFILLLSTAITACGNNDKSTSSEQTYTPPVAEKDTTSQNSSVPEGSTASTSKGAQLIAASDCLSCHKEQEKLVGPAYADVAKKYTTSDVAMLAGKIIKGGSGNWGEIPMTPHPTISTADAKEMANYILSLK